MHGSFKKVRWIHIIWWLGAISVQHLINTHAAKGSSSPESISASTFLTFNIILTCCLICVVTESFDVDASSPEAAFNHVFVGTLGHQGMGPGIFLEISKFINNLPIPWLILLILGLLITFCHINMLVLSKQVMWSPIILSYSFKKAA